jgi:hypothetical protein
VNKDATSLSPSLSNLLLTVDNASATGLVKFSKGRLPSLCGPGTFVPARYAPHSECVAMTTPQYLIHKARRSDHAPLVSPPLRNAIRRVYSPPFRLTRRRRYVHAPVWGWRVNHLRLAFRSCRQHRHGAAHPLPPLLRGKGNYPQLYSSALLPN